MIDQIDWLSEAEERHYRDYDGYHGCECPWCECRCDEPLTGDSPLRVPFGDLAKIT